MKTRRQKQQQPQQHEQSPEFEAPLDSPLDSPRKKAIMSTTKPRRMFHCNSCNASRAASLPLPCFTHTTAIADELFQSRAFATCPKQLSIEEIPSTHEKGVFTKTRLSTPVIFGPLVGDVSKIAEKHAQHQYSVIRAADGGSRWFYRLNSDDTCNWMRYVRRAGPDHEGNVLACQYGEDVYFATTGPLGAGTELRVQFLDAVSKSVDSSVPAVLPKQSYTDTGASVPCWADNGTLGAFSHENRDPAAAVQPGPLDGLYNYLPDAELPDPQPLPVLEQPTRIVMPCQSDVLCRVCRRDLMTKVKTNKESPWTCTVCPPTDRPCYPVWANVKRHIKACHTDGLCSTCHTLSPPATVLTPGTSLILPSVQPGDSALTAEASKKRAASSERPEPAKRPGILNFEKTTELALLQAVLDANPYQFGGLKSRAAQQSWRELYDRLLAVGDVLVCHGTVNGPRKLRVFAQDRVTRYNRRQQDRKDLPPETQVMVTDAVLGQLADLIRLQAEADKEKADRVVPHPCVYCGGLFPSADILKYHKRKEHYAKGVARILRLPRRPPRNETPQTKRDFQDRFLREILQAVVAGRPYDSFAGSPTASKAWLAIHNDLVMAGHYKPSSPKNLLGDIGDFRRFLRDLVRRQINSATPNSDPQIEDLIQQIHEMMQNEPSGGCSRDVLTDEFVEERLQAVLDNNPYQFRRFSRRSRAAWEDIREELVAAGHLRPVALTRDCWMLRSFVQRQIEQFRADLLSGTLDRDSPRNQLLERISDFMKRPAQLQAPTDEFVEEKLQAVADANPYRFLDFNSGRAVWSSIYDGLVALKCIQMETQPGWRSLRNWVREVVIPDSWRPSYSEEMAGRKDDLIKKIFSQIRQREVDQLVQAGLPAFLCLKCVRKYESQEQLAVHDQETHQSVGDTEAGPGRPRKRSRRRQY